MKQNKDTYKSKATKAAFLDWLKTFEMPEEEFDYEETYVKVSNEFFKLFQPDPDYFDNIFLKVIDNNVNKIEDALQHWWDTLPENDKAMYKSEGYDEEEKLGAMSYGEYSYSVSSPYFIKNFANPDAQKAVLGMHIAAIYKYLAYEMNINPIPEYWQEYNLKH